MDYWENLYDKVMNVSLPERVMTGSLLRQNLAVMKELCKILLSLATSSHASLCRRNKVQFTLPPRSSDPLVPYMFLILSLESSSALFIS